MSTILFSGRFDKPHLGHLITIQRLMRQYDMVVVVVLDYPEANYDIDFRMNVLNEALLNSKGSFIITKNETNFGEITDEELEEFPCFQYYGSGNKKVLKHIKSLGGNTIVVYVPRYPGYSASKEED